MEHDLDSHYLATMNAGSEFMRQEWRERFFIPNDDTFYQHPNVKWRPEQKVCVRRTHNGWILVREWTAEWHKQFPAYEAQILYRYYTINLDWFRNNHARIEITHGPYKGKKISVKV